MSWVECEVKMDQVNGYETRTDMAGIVETGTPQYHYYKPILSENQSKS